MNYEQKYKDLINRLREYRERFGNPLYKEIGEEFPELRESDDEKIRKELIRDIDIAMPIDTAQKYIAWLKNQDEQKLCMIQWKGNNLKDVLDFTGKNKNFDKWFKSFEEFEKYVCEHNNIFKLFNSDGSHFEVPIGAWIIKTPDGYNVASKAIFKPKHTDKVEPKLKKIEQKQEWSEEDEYIFDKIIHWAELVNPTSSMFEKLPKEQFIEKLKSLKPNHWKPSEEQMQALKKRTHGLHISSETRKALESLINDLGKL